MNVPPDNILNSIKLIECEIFGKIVSISEPNELVRGNRTRDANVFFDVDFYIINKYNYAKHIGLAKAYIPFSKIGVNKNKSILYYYTKNKEWQTSLDPITLKKRTYNVYANFTGYLKKITDKKEIKYTHFMTNISKIILYPDHKK